MDGTQDFLEEIIAERTKSDPEFPARVDAALRERQLLRALAAKRVELHLSQTVVAARMGTSQSALARLERGEADPRLSTLERYAAALGQTLEWRLVS